MHVASIYCSQDGMADYLGGFEYFQVPLSRAFPGDEPLKCIQEPERRYTEQI